MFAADAYVRLFEPLSYLYSLPLQEQGPLQLQLLQPPPKLPSLVISHLPVESAPHAHPITLLSRPLLWGLATPSGSHTLSLGLLTHLLTFRSVGSL